MKPGVSEGWSFVEQVSEVMTKVEAEAAFAFGHVYVTRRSWDAPIDMFGNPSEHRLELALLPISAAARCCFLSHWRPNRFERIGNLFLFPAEQPVHTISDCRQQQSIACSFIPAAVQTWFDGDLEWTDSRLTASLDITNSTIRSLLFRLGDEVRNPGFASQAMIEMMAGQIAIELARYCMGAEETKSTGGLSPWKLRLIDERLAEVGNPPLLSELATLCGLSVRHLTRAFRISRRRSIGSYITECRINQAKRLLVSGECVKSIAYSMGFASPSNFSVAFRRGTGETPREYRQRVARTAVRH